MGGLFWGATTINLMTEYKTIAILVKDIVKYDLKLIFSF